MLTLHGLAIDMVGDPATPRRPEADVRWLRRRSQTPLATAPAPGWAWRVFSGQGGAACGFAVSPDGREVISETTDVVSERDEFGLFAEAVMRTVLRRQGLVSFHAAALARGGRAVLLLGRKGAGKSSFAAALARAGWSLLADDMARVVEREGTWRVASGYRQTKLNADVATALGYDLTRLQRRWTPGQPADETPNKFVLTDEIAGGPETTPIAAIYVLAPRIPHASGLVLAPVAPAGRFRLMMRNLSDDPLDEAAGTPDAATANVMSLLAAAPLMRLALPDNLGRLAEAAAAFEAP